LRHDEFPPLPLRTWGGESTFGANPFKRRRHFLFARKRNALGFAVLRANAAARDTVKRAGNDGFAGGRVPIKNICGAEVKALQVGEAHLAVDGGEPGKPLSPSAKYRHRIFS
jgi:hypothetical protein